MEIGTHHSCHPWYESSMINAGKEKTHAPPNEGTNAGRDLTNVWKVLDERLLPVLLQAVGHPYESCRNHIAGCLFRMHTSHRTLTISNAHGITDPTPRIIGRLMNVAAQPDLESKAYYNSLITLRKFVAYCVHLGNTVDEFRRCVLPLMPVAFTSLRLATEDTASSDGEGEVDTAIRAVQTEIVKGFRYSIAEISVACMLGYAENGSRDVDGVLDSLDVMKDDGVWHVRQALAHFLRCFQGGHVFLFGASQEQSVRKTVSGLLADDRSEVSTAAMSTLTGILAATDASVVGGLVTKYAKIASRSKQPRKKKKATTTTTKVEPLRTSGEVRGGGDSGTIVETAVTLQEKEEAEQTTSGL